MTQIIWFDIVWPGLIVMYRFLWVIETVILVDVLKVQAKLMYIL